MPNIELLADGIREAVKEGLNKTIVQVRGMTAQEVAKEYNIADRGFIPFAKKRIYVKKANRKDLKAILGVKGTRYAMVPLIFFPHNQDAVGVNVQVGGETISIPHAFINRAIKSNRENVFIRASKYNAPDNKYTKYKGIKAKKANPYTNQTSDRYPIVKPRGVHMSQLANDIIFKRIDTRVNKMLALNITAALQKAAK